MNDQEFYFKNEEELKQFLQDYIVNTSEAIEILGCSRQYLNQLIKSGVVKPVKEFPRDRLFIRAEIEERKEHMGKRKKS
ncbi:helix-turn-helix transcriptional regulator [Bacillus sp. Hm123]|uniref:helix-turn-helix transcriptional regulator n=1 Tax=Bacillus sp. Hm123 TaxID=3450745 RepID=UPI003F43BD06